MDNKLLLLMKLEKTIQKIDEIIDSLEIVDPKTSKEESLIKELRIVLNIQDKIKNKLYNLR